MDSWLSYQPVKLTFFSMGFRDHESNTKMVFATGTHSTLPSQYSGLCSPKSYSRLFPSRSPHWITYPVAPNLPCLVLQYGWRESDPHSGYSSYNYSYILALSLSTTTGLSNYFHKTFIPMNVSELMGTRWRPP
jgi:hypothetical protein